MLGGDAAGLVMLNALGLHAHAAIGAADIGDPFDKLRIAVHGRPWERSGFNTACDQSAGQNTREDKA